MTIIQYLEKEIKPSKDYILGSIKIHFRTLYYAYNETLCDSFKVNEYILKSLVKLKFWQLYSLEIKIPNCHITTISKEDVLYYLNNGYFVLFFNKIYAFEIRSNLSRGITNTSELSLNGPKDSFCEVYQMNLGLIRKRIKSENLKVKQMTIGNYTKTIIGILYIDKITNIRLVEDIQNSFSKINIDGIIDSSYLKNSLENHSHIFPTIIATERPDKCSMALLEGKVVILVDNTPYALILPSFFIDFFHTTDDYYQKDFHTSFIRIIRLFAALIAIFIPALYISITTRNYSLVPLDLLLVLKAGRTFVPFPAYCEAFFLIICFEILKESDIRMSNMSGSAISILGGLILGDAAVSAGIVSPIMIIVIAISSIAGLIFSSIELGNALRTYKLLLLLLASLFGIYGIVLGSIILFIDLYTTKIFGYSYIIFDRNEIKDSFIRTQSRIKKRNSKITDNIIRGWYR